MHEDQFAIVMKKRKKATPQRAAHSSRSHRKPVSRTRSKRAKDHSATSFALAAECMVADATSLKTSLASFLDTPRTVTLDVSKLRRIDTASLQVIAAFILHREAQGRQVEWKGDAPALSTAARLLGLTPVLRLPESVGPSDGAL
jgi:ABC-type transporter Mla MlaB component